MRSTGMMNARLNGIESRRLARYIYLTLLLFVALTAISFAPAQAADEGHNIPISVVDGGAEPAVLLGDDQQNPSIIALPDKNKWFVVWEDWRNWSTSGTDIYGRFINDDGTLCGEEIAISTASGNQTVPVLAYRNTVSGTDNIMIAWQDSRGSTTSGYIYYKIINISSLASNCSSGTVLGSAKAVGYKSIDGDNLISRKLPKVAYDKARDQFWMVWVESRDQLQRLVEYPFGYHGSPEWQFADSNYISFTTASASGSDVATPEILRNTDGSSLRTVRLLSSTSEFDEDGGTATYIYEYFTDINNVTVVCDDSSPEALIAWEGIRGKATLTCEWEEKDEETINECHEESERDDYGDLVCRDDSHEIAVCGAAGASYSIIEVCEDVPNPNYGVPTRYDAYSSELKTEHDSGGSTDGMVHIYSMFDKYIAQPVVHTQLVDSSDVPSYYPSLGYDPIHRKFLVAWEDRRDGLHSNIFGQLIYSGGGLYGSNFPISYQDLDGDGALDNDINYSNQTRPNVCLDLTNQRFFISWQDGRNSGIASEDLDIYGQWVDSEGSLRGYNYAVCVDEDNQYNPITAYNQANHQFMTVWKDARNLNTSNSDIYGQRYTSEQQAQFIFKNGVYVAPPSLDFPYCEIGSSTILDVVITNRSGSDLEVARAVTGTDAYSVSGIIAGDILAAGATLTCQVTFKPTDPGYFEDSLIIIIGSTQYSVELKGGANANFAFTEHDTFTADLYYKAKVSASTAQSGQLFVLLSHDPLSVGNIYAMTSSGSLQAFPYGSTFGWQSLSYLDSAAPGLDVDLSSVDFRGLGCTLCQGPDVNDGNDGFVFGNIFISPPDDDVVFNNATDFKYMPGTLYMATYVNDAASGGAFDFNQGLLEMQSLHINSLNGTWQVMSRYNNENRVHPTHLVVTETGDGNISAVWPGYNVTMIYGSDESGYVMTFSMGIYNYTYKITNLTAYTFSGTYSCVANGQILDEQPVCGVRAGSGLECELPGAGLEVDEDKVIAHYDGVGEFRSPTFTTTGPWKLQWTSSRNSLNLFLYDDAGHIVDSSSSGQGTLYQNTSGAFTVNIKSMYSDFSWEIYIVSTE